MKVFRTIDTYHHPYTELTAAGRSKNLSFRTTNANKIYNEAVKQYGKDGFICVFVSIHANAASNPDASGYEIFVLRHGGEAHELAKKVYTAAENILGVGSTIKSRGIKTSPFAVLNNTAMPAILVEHEFYTNLNAVAKLKDSTFRQLCAEHLAVGILDYIETRR